MDAIINSFEPQEIINILAKKYRVKVTSDGAESILKLPKRIGEGSIKGIDFLYGMGLFHFDCIFHNDVILKFKGNKEEPIQFMFCDKGEVVHILNHNFRYKLNPMVGSIANSTHSNEQIFMFPPNKQISFLTLDIDKENFYPKIEKDLDSVPAELAEVFKGSDGPEYFLYQSDYSLNIAECLNEMRNNEHEGVVKRIFLESKALDLIWMQIKQYKDDKNALSKQSILRKTDMKLIMKAKNILVADLKTPPDINKLAELSGTNATKLKNGFKLLYDKTINHYLRNERLNKAKILLAEDNLSIKEISEAVGYTNKGIFSKRFKEKFGVLPSTFLGRYKSNGK
jgi:AraC-like DNA-binding protein